MNNIFYFLLSSLLFMFNARAADDRDEDIYFGSSSSSSSCSSSSSSVSLSYEGEQSEEDTSFPPELWKDDPAQFKSMVIAAAKGEMKTTSGQSIQLHLVTETLNQFSATPLNFMFNFFLHHYAQIKDGFQTSMLEDFSNEHTVKKLESQFKLSIFNKIKLGEVDQKILKDLLPNYDNVKAAADNKRKKLKNKQIEELVSVGASLNFGSLHLDNFVKEVRHAHGEKTNEFVLKKLEEYLSAPANLMSQAFTFASTNGLLSDFFLKGFTSACFVIRRAHLENWLVRKAGVLKDDEYTLQAKKLLQGAELLSKQEDKVHELFEYRIAYFWRAIANETGVSLTDLSERKTEEGQAAFKLGIKKLRSEFLQKFELDYIASLNKKDKHFFEIILKSMI